MTITTTKPFLPATEQNASSKTPAQRTAILSDPGFGRYFTDHMVIAEWTPADGWHNERIVPYGPLPLDPAAAVLHYAPEIFEGLKAYRDGEGSVRVFRPEQNAARFQRSAKRISLPQLPTDWFVDSIDALITIDESWVPTGGENALYLRPFMFGSEPMLGVRTPEHVTYAVIASPVGGYFKEGIKPVDVWLAEDFTRAAIGGTGAAKTGGNYAGGLLPYDLAAEHGCEQVAYLDGAEHRFVEELGGMNLFFVHDDGTIVTPASASILDGIVKNSLLELATDLGYSVAERQFAVDEWIHGVRSGHITEVFACGTAAAITPVGRLVHSEGEINSAPNGYSGPVTSRLRTALLDIQYGRAADLHGWMHAVGA